MEKSFIQTAGGKISCRTGGRGNDLILLHSLSLSGNSWEKVFGPLAENHRVHAVDMLGHGDSDKPTINYRIEDYAASFIDFMDTRKMEKAILCGNSVGALIAMEMAASNPERVEKLILVGCPIRDSWERAERLAFSALGLAEDGSPKPVALADLKMSYVHPTEELLNKVNEGRAKAGLWLKKTLIAIALYDPLPKLPLVQCPTLVIFGATDTLREKEKTLLQGIKGAKRATIEGAGHVPQEEKPTVFMEELSRFLNSRS